MARFKGGIFGLKKVGKYLTDSDLRKAYAEYKESEEMAFRLIVNTILSEGWIISLSQPRTCQEVANEFSYTNIPLLENILTLLVKNGVLRQEGETYSIKELKATPIRPEDVGTVLTNFYFDCAQFLPDALRGQTVALESVPRIVLESVFSSTMTKKGRGVLLRSFAPKNAKEIGVSAFADVGLPYALQQVNEIFDPARIHLFMQNYRWLSLLTSILSHLSGNEVLGKLTTDILGRKIEEQLDLFYGEELFAFSHDSLEERVRIVSSCLKPGAKLITNDPTLSPGESVSSPAYILMQTIEGYPQPVKRDEIHEIFSRHKLTAETIGDNWIIAVKEGA